MDKSYFSITIIIGFNSFCLLASNTKHSNIRDFFSKTANFDINKRDLIVYIKSKYEVTYYKEHLGGGVIRLFLKDIN